MSRIEQVQKLHPKLDIEEVKKLDSSKNFKYLGWIAANFKFKDEIPEIIKQFEKHSSKLEEKDINKYSFAKLKECLGKVKPSRKEEKVAGSIFVGKVEDISIYFMETYAAAKQYCAGTKWCISERSRFTEYSMMNNLFVFSKGEAKMAALVPINGHTVTFYDAKDNEFHQTDDFDKFIGNTLLKQLSEQVSSFSKKNKNPYAKLIRNAFNTRNVNNFEKVTGDKFLQFIKCCVASYNLTTGQVKKLITFAISNKNDQKELFEYLKNCNYSCSAGIISRIFKDSLPKEKRKVSSSELVTLLRKIYPNHFNYYSNDCINLSGLFNDTKAKEMIKNYVEGKEVEIE